MTCTECKCDRLIFSTQNPMARDKHENSYGEYFLFDTFDEAPVYQHFAGKAFKLLIKIYPFLVNFVAANPIHMTLI